MKLPSRDLENLKTKAIEASKKAGEVLRHYFEGDFEVREKGKEGLVTIADETAEKEAIEILSSLRDDFGFLAEESGEKKESSHAGRWIIDPLDGTTNFV